MIRPRLREIDAMVGLLDAEHESVDELARQVIHTSFGMLMRRELFVLVFVQDSALWVHGPYMTRRQAEKSLLTAELPRHGRVFIRRLITSTADGEEDE